MLKKFEHVAIIVRDLQEAIEFYTEVLNFKLRMETTIGEERKIAFLHLIHDTTFEIELIEELKNLPVVREDGHIDHLAFIVENLQEAIHTLKEKHVEFINEQPKNTAAGDLTIYFRGLNKEIIQLIEKK